MPDDPAPEAKMSTSNEELIAESLFAPERIAYPKAPRMYLEETFLEDYFVEFNGRASARWSIEYDERQPDSPRVYAYPKLHYVEVNTPHRIIRLEHDEIHAKTRAAIEGLLEDELECMG